jgi:hypothetical protein
MAEQIRVNGPNGLVVNFPAGTSPETISRVMQEAAGGQQPAQQPSGPAMTMLGAANQGARSGLAFNFNDELTGSRAAGLEGLPQSVRAVAERVPAPLSAVVAPVGAARLAAERAFPQTFGTRATEAYTAARDRERALDKAAEEQFPLTYYGTNIGSSLLVPAGAAARAGLRGATVAGGLTGAAADVVDTTITNV